MRKTLTALALAALSTTGSFATAAAPALAGVQAIDWNHDGSFATTGATAVFLDSAHGLLWSNTTIDRGTMLSFAEATNLVASYNASGSIEGIRTWALPTQAQFEMLYATQGFAVAPGTGIERRVFDPLSSYAWTSTAGTLAGSHKAFGANFLLSDTANQFKSYGDSAKMTVWAVSAVPEPETYVMLLAGLGVVGVAYGRRNKASQ